MAFIKWMDSQSRLVKVLFCLPIIDIIWGVYRVVGCFVKKKINVLRLILAIVWLLWAGFIGWILDLVCIILFDHICWFKD